MRIRLTPEQIRELMPYFERVQACAVQGHPGMLVAQLRYEDIGMHSGSLEPAFLENKFAQLVTERGRDLVKLPPRLADLARQESNR